MTRFAIHPGEILAEELAEIAVTPTELFPMLRAGLRAAVAGALVLKLGKPAYIASGFALRILRRVANRKRILGQRKPSCSLPKSLCKLIVVDVLEFFLLITEPPGPALND